MLRLGCCCYICKRWFFVDSQEGLLSSRGGGPDILAPGLQYLIGIFGGGTFLEVETNSNNACN